METVPKTSSLEAGTANHADRLSSITKPVKKSKSPGNLGEKLGETVGGGGGDAVWSNPFSKIILRGPFDDAEIETLTNVIQYV